nr:hypothetical protein [Tanacetum cinerariifolium]
TVTPPRQPPTPRHATIRAPPSSLSPSPSSYITTLLPLYEPPLPLPYTKGCLFAGQQPQGGKGLPYRIRGTFVLFKMVRVV